MYSPVRALLLVLLLPLNIIAQHIHHEAAVDVEAQPLLSHAIRLNEALSFLGSALPAESAKKLDELQHHALDNHTVHTIQQLFDPFCIAVVTINPEGRVSVDKGKATPALMQGGWTSFLVRINNQAGATPELKAESPNALPAQHAPSFDPIVKKENVISKGQVENRFLDIQLYKNKPMLANLSGLKLEYAIVQIYSKDKGKREVELGFNVGQGSQDIGFRNSIHLLFDIQPSVKLVLDVKDYDGTPAMASFTFSDSIQRSPGKLSGVYPLPSRRVAAYDEYPDFFFQKQVYRTSGEHVMLAPGKYQVSFTRGPEYIPQTTVINIPADRDSVKQTFSLKRWINLAKLGWYSADHHIHAAGCSHYDSPEEGVKPVDMWRQIVGEDLNFAAVLTWGPGWYHQKQYFTGKDHPLSNKKNVMRYDVEVSGFPSSHSGHLVLLGVKEDDYPGTTTIEEWPSWTLPVLKWARSQGATTGYAHSGWGLSPMIPTWELPNYITPKMDWIGANEYIVTVAHGLIDVYSAGDTPAPWELNMWYHTLNCGFTPRLSGETDYPCITDDRVGQARSYFKPQSTVSYDNYLQALKSGRSYVSDGASHIMNFSVNGQEAGVKDSRLKLKSKQAVTITADVAGYLPEKQTPFYADLVKVKVKDGYYWNIESARVDTSRRVRVELIVNGFAVDTTEIVGDGTINKIKFTHHIDRSSWVALRVYTSSHSNPVFVDLDGKPVAEKKSAEWCLNALEQCWKMKEPNIRQQEKEDAKVAYDYARKIYQSIIEGNQITINDSKGSNGSNERKGK